METVHSHCSVWPAGLISCKSTNIALRVYNEVSANRNKIRNFITRIQNATWDEWQMTMLRGGPKIASEWWQPSLTRDLCWCSTGQKYLLYHAIADGDRRYLEDLSLLYVILRFCRNSTQQESCAAARKQSNAAVVLFCLKFAIDIHYKYYIHPSFC